MIALKQQLQVRKAIIDRLEQLLGAQKECPLFGLALHAGIQTASHMAEPKWHLLQKLDTFAMMFLVVSGSKTFEEAASILEEELPALKRENLDYFYVIEAVLKYMKTHELYEVKVKKLRYN